MSLGNHQPRSLHKGDVLGVDLSIGVVPIFKNTFLYTKPCVKNNGLDLLYATDRPPLKHMLSLNTTEFVVKAMIDS